MFCMTWGGWVDAVRVLGDAMGMLGMRFWVR